MWKVIYCPAQGENRSPYEEIMGFGNKQAAKVFGQIDLNANKETTSEWSGSVKLFSYQKKKWLQWTWGQFRVHFIQVHEIKTIVILNAFLKTSDNTKTKFKNRTYDNLIYWESTNQ